MPKGHSKQKKSIGVLIFIAIVILAIILLSKSCNRCYNTVNDSHFNCDGTLIVDSSDISFQPTMPAKIKFFVEVSGSMKGFFRTNQPTDFKKDVYEVMSYYREISDIVLLTGDGSKKERYSLNDFNQKMKKGDFSSSDWTQMPIMIKNITDDVDVKNGEVAVLISDMVYSPGGNDAAVSLDQYDTYISEVFGDFGYAICLIGATSNFLDKMGNTTVASSPYYYLILGAPETVAELRNGISTLLDNNGHFIDNIESGLNYGTRPSYSFEISENCYQLDDEPTFIGFNPSGKLSCTRNTNFDTCTIKLKVNLENYRWRITDEDVFRDAFKCKALNGSEVQIGDVTIVTQNIVNAQLNRKAIATVDLKLFHMPLDADVIEWTLKLPNINTTKYTPYLGATSENDRRKTYSLENFLDGMFYMGVVNDSLKPNYILVSKKS